MFTRGIIQNTEDYFKELNQRPDKCIYFYRMNGYNEKCRQFIGEYAKEARKSGIVGSLTVEYSKKLSQVA